MAALRDIARDFAAEIRDGIGWTIVYRTGRSWNALTIWSDIWNGEWETNDLNDAIGILKADPDAVIVNGYARHKNEVNRQRHPEIDYYDNDYLVLLTADTVRETEFSDLTHALCDLTVARAQ